MIECLLIAGLIILLFLYRKEKGKSALICVENKKILSAKKSSEVRLGNIVERMVPFLDNFNYEPSNAQFLGQPIDYVVFEDEEIVFIEVKSGNARLSSKQRRIKKLVENGKIRWEEIRIK